MQVKKLLSDYARILSDLYQRRHGDVFLCAAVYTVALHNFVQKYRHELGWKSRNRYKLSIQSLYIAKNVQNKYSKCQYADVKFNNLAISLLSRQKFASLGFLWVTAMTNTSQALLNSCTG